MTNRIPERPLSRKAFCIMDALVTLQDLVSAGVMEAGNTFTTQEGMRWYLAEKATQPPITEEETIDAIDTLRAAGIIES